MQYKIWEPNKPDERKYIYDPEKNVLLAEWTDEAHDIVNPNPEFHSEPARDYRSENRNPSDEEIEKDVQLLKAMDRMGF